MESAFGVEHGYVSKGFLGRLRPAKAAVKAVEAARPVGGTSSAKHLLGDRGNVYALSRDTAKTYGQSASRSWKSNPDQAAVHRMMGQESKRTSRRTLQTAYASRPETHQRFLP